MVQIRHPSYKINPYYFKYIKNAHACFTVRLFRDIQQRPETVNDSCALSDTLGMMNQNQPITSVLVQTVANEDIFWRKKNLFFQFEEKNKKKLSAVKFTQYLEIFIDNNPMIVKQRV